MSLEEFLAEWHNDSPTLLVHTSGSTGKPKPMWVEKRRMEASARMTLDFLGLCEGDTALLCLPLDYIAGKMMVVRSLVGHLRLLPMPPSGHPLSSTSHPLPLITFAAMVPMQVYNSMQVPEEYERLRQIRHLIIGGGAIDERLERRLLDFPHAVWSTYGMTETLSHIALRRLNGGSASSWYTPLPGIHVSANEDDCLVVDAPQLHDGPLVTNDIVELLSEGRFRILGRKDNVVCSGGIKIQIEEVERRLATHLSSPFVLTKCKDERLGEVLVLLTEDQNLNAVDDICRRVLPKYWQPREIRFVEKIPMTETGKVKRSFT